MRHTEVAIAGGGLAGSVAAAMLGRAGIPAVVIDPHPVYPPELRCEKLDSAQLAVLRRTGLADAVLRAATPDTEAWVARLGRVVERRPGDQHGILYDTLVNAVRAEVRPPAQFVCGKVTAAATGPDRQIVTLADGEQVSARLLVVANGLNIALRHSLGMGRTELSRCHSVTLGFDLKPRGGASFPFGSLSHYSERPADRAAYLTLFPVGASMRANFMVYRDLDDPWLPQFKQAPEAVLLATLPGLRKLLGDFEVVGPIKVRPADLYATTDYLQPGVVLVGDAFGTSCPAAGTGTGKVFTDVERLCNEYIPRWLATDGMGVDKIAAFYADPVKRACDAASLAKAYALRSLSIDPGLPWALRRLARFAVRLAVGTLRQARRRVSPGSRPPRPGAAAEALQVGWVEPFAKPIDQSSRR
jgi:2-polyprenyl-6-methoxyphenol hydroxylase-like FAD-dependent oxidoreductase